MKTYTPTEIAAIKRTAAEQARCNALNAVVQEAYRRAKQPGRSRDYILACDAFGKFALAEMEKSQ